MKNRTTRLSLTVAIGIALVLLPLLARASSANFNVVATPVCGELLISLENQQFATHRCLTASDSAATARAPPRRESRARVSNRWTNRMNSKLTGEEL